MSPKKPVKRLKTSFTVVVSDPGSADEALEYPTFAQVIAFLVSIENDMAPEAFARLQFAILPSDVCTLTATDEDLAGLH